MTRCDVRGGLEESPGGVSGMISPLDAFLPVPDVRERFAVTVKAPRDVVYEVATEFDMQSVPLIRAIVWMRERLLRSQVHERPAKALLAEMKALGWGCLVSRPGELFVAGAVCQPWLPDVAFSPVPLSADGAAQVLDRLKGRKILDGVRGAPAADIDALLDLIVKLSRLAADHADTIAEIDLNPVLVHPAGEGVSIVDALIVKRGAG